MTNDYDPNYLAHSKGPWKKPTKYIKKVGGKYYYAKGKNYLRAVANNPLATNTEKKAARTTLNRRITDENIKRAGKKYKKQLRAEAVSNAVSSAKAKARTTANKARAAVKNAPEYAKYNAKRAGYLTKLYGNMAAVKTKKAAKKAYVNAANSKAGKAVRKAAWRTGLAVSNKSRRARRKAYTTSVKALNSARAASKKGRAAINKLFTNIKNAKYKSKNRKSYR